jgi:hypothetical protein
MDDEDIVMVHADDADVDPKSGSRESRHSDRRSRKKVREPLKLEHTSMFGA